MIEKKYRKVKKTALINNKINLCNYIKFYKMYF